MTYARQLNGAEFAQLIKAGHARLKQMVGVVNALNIFPVPDGDTGTNMELSLASGAAQLDNHAGKTLHTVTQDFAAGLLMGARGNSGVILSQLFRGFSKVTQNSTALDPQLFAKALHEGVQIAYRAVAKPVEGTILSVAREAAAVGLKEARKHTNLSEWMHVVYDAASRALEKTPEQLPVLKQAGVVDSGGQGLVFILEGFDMWLRGEAPHSDTDEYASKSDAIVDLDFAAAHIDHEGEYGYCTEVLLRLEGNDTSVAEAELRETLSQYGDSLLVVGAGNLVKVHVHTLRPGRVLEDALTYGALAKIKIDNMTEQHATIHEAAGPAARSKRPEPIQERKGLAVVAVAAGDGLQEVFKSLGVDIVVSGGQTMNPSTEDIVAAVRAANADHVMVLPNNKNIVMAAQQASEVQSNIGVHVVPTTSVPEGIAAMMAFNVDYPPLQNLNRMQDAIASVHSGQVVRAVRDSVYQDRKILADQYLGFANQTLIYVGDNRITAVVEVVREMGGSDAELLTMFYGGDVPKDELTALVDTIEATFGLETEVQFGGQPVYDYIFSLE